MKILTVCGMGNGSSLILKINVDDILRSLDLKATVENVDVASFKSIPTNIIFLYKRFRTIFKRCYCSCLSY